MGKAGFELRGARLKIEVVPQMQKDGTPHPNGYMDVKKVYDANGNEPGKSGSAPQPMQAAPQQQQTVQSTPNQGWQQGPSNAAPSAAPANAGWNNQPPQNNQNTAGGWQQLSQQAAPGNAAPPWAARS